MADSEVDAKEPLVSLVDMVAYSADNCATCEDCSGACCDSSCTMTIGVSVEALFTEPSVANGAATDDFG
jgi:hypothetical protein